VYFFVFFFLILKQKQKDRRGINLRRSAVDANVWHFFLYLCCF
jgi:hypothetical protein